MKWLMLLLVSPVCFASPYFSDEALNRTKEAILIQSGLQKLAEQAGQFYQDKAVKIVRQYNLETEVGVIGMGFRIYRTRTITFRLYNKNFSLSPDFINKTYSVGVSWSW